MNIRILDVTRGIVLLTVFSALVQVSSLFKDGTIGTDINIVVVSLLLLEQDPVSRLRQFS